MAGSIPTQLDKARRALIQGIRLSKQSAYARRAPDPSSLPYFNTCRRTLQDILEEFPRNREALMMMSAVSESLMQFDDAIQCVELAIESGENMSRKLLKRLAVLRQEQEFWRHLALSPDSLRHLGSYLEAAGVGPGNTTTKLTEAWLESSGISDPAGIIASLQRFGAYSDFQILANIVRG